MQMSRRFNHAKFHRDRSKELALARGHAGVCVTAQAGTRGSGLLSQSLSSQVRTPMIFAGHSPDFASIKEGTTSSDAMAFFFFLE